MNAECIERRAKDNQFCILHFAFCIRAPQGLSLLETTIAIAVIVTGLFAAFTLVFANRRAGDEASLRFGAVQLAREGVEVVRAIRDSNWLAGRPWDEGIVGGAGSTGIAQFNPGGVSWQIEYGPAAFTDAKARVVIERTATNEAYWTQGAASDAAVAATPYRRLIDTVPICADQKTIEERGAPCDPDATPKIGMQIRSRVRWTSRGNTHETIAEERLYDWR